MLFVLIASVFAESIVEMVNNNPESTWVAIEYPYNVMNINKFRASLGTHVLPWTRRVTPAANGVPDNFDSRSEWGSKILPVRDQQSCGSCWAFSIAESIGDRLGVKGCSKGHMSPQDLVSCDTTDYGCDGGIMDRAWAWTKSHGITTEACMSYVSGDGVAPSCPSKCDNGTAIVRTKSTSYKKLTASQMQQEIMTNGPIGVAFTVYSDFMNYKSGVYRHISGFIEGGHAILCIGWGVEDGTPYWLCQNSWGPSWGEAGHFKILRGSNECGIEDQAYAAQVSC